MSIAEFSTALKNKANSTQREAATRMLQELVVGSLNSYSSSNEMVSSASILNKGTFKRYARKSGKIDPSKTVTMNMTDLFRDTGEKQGNTALVLTGADLEIIFNTLGISASEGTPMEAYIDYLRTEYGDKYNARHFEVYTEELVYNKSNVGSAKLSTILSKASNITAIRALNFSHANALIHLASFIQKKVPGKSSIPLLEIQKEISSKFHRGHIYAQTTGRAMVSTRLITDKSSPLLQLVELSKKLDEVSSGLQNNNIELLLAVDKDFLPGKSPRMNVAFQLITDESGTGNADTGKLSASLRIVGMLQSLIDNSELSQSLSQLGKRGSGIKLKNTPIAGSIANFAKTLDAFIDKLDANNSDLYNRINSIVSAYTDPLYLANLRTSDSIREYIVNDITSIISNKPRPRLKVNVKTSAVKSKKVTSNSSTSYPKAQKLLADVKKLIDSNITNLSGSISNRPQQTSRVNLGSLLLLINSNLQHVVSANMGGGSDKKVLNYRTGRFAASASVERLSESRAGMITAFYSYMKNPYATFSEGGAQSTPVSRDPKLLISKSIREIVATKVGNQLRAVSV